VARTAKAATRGGPLKLARNELRNQSGFVLDWTALNGTQTNFTFNGDTTYYVSGVQHLGRRNPVTEGFTLDSSSGSSVFPVTGDMGGNSWALVSGVGPLIYRHSLSPQLQGMIVGADWLLAAENRIISGSANGLAFYAGSQHFVLSFSLDANGDRVVYSHSSVSPVLLLNGAGAGYHDYKLYYHAGTGVADLWVDGSLRLNDIQGTSGGSSWAVWWGAGQSGGGNVNRVNWNSVSLAIVPEPSALGLLCVGGLLMAARAR